MISFQNIGSALLSKTCLTAAIISLSIFSMLSMDENGGDCLKALACDFLLLLWAISFLVLSCSKLSIIPCIVYNNLSEYYVSGLT